MAGMFLYWLKQTAKAIGTDEGNCHRQRIKEDETFYKHWLVPRLERFYRQQGWSVGDGLVAEGTAASPVVEPADGLWCPSGNTNLTSPRSCKPFGLKAGSRLKHALKRLKPARRREDKTNVEALQPQVGDGFKFVLAAVADAARVFYTATLIPSLLVFLRLKIWASRRGF